MGNVERLEALSLECQAGRIGDPIERLCFLREATRGRLHAAEGFKAAPRRPARRSTRLWLAACLLLACPGLVSEAVRPGPATGWALGSLAGDVPEVWLVERTPDWELYSNGLRIEHRLAVSTRLRLHRPQALPDSQTAFPHWHTRPAGIVYHASEGELTVFAPQHTGWIERQGMDLLRYAQRHRLYHYVVDRFGRVHRIVEDIDVADHAGHSLWADARNVYLSLNASFLGVAFEARTQGAEQGDLLSPAQVHAGRVLTELLRSKYRIPLANCVTHAQVSVNPFNSQIGFHADWARHFPYKQLGLPDNYRQPPPSVALFGFEYEPAFFDAAGPSLRAALVLAREEFEREAAARGLTPGRWRAAMQRRYRQAAAEAHTQRAALEALARLEVY